MLHWLYETDACRDAGARPPERMRLPYGDRDQESPFNSRDYAIIWRAIEAGYEVKPHHCPPVRVISRYGILLRCPGAVYARRLAERTAAREFSESRARYGIVEVAGDLWPIGDSGFIASWIAGSEFVKVQTGISILFPADWCLYQGPIPNQTLLDGSGVEVMAGIEYAVDKRTREMGGVRYGVANMNVIVRLPPIGAALELSSGTPLAWAFPLLPPSRIEITPLVSDEKAD
jgi:hypothetical protein